MRILDYNGRDADRTVTVATIAGLKAAGERLAQVTVGTAAEAAAAEAAGIEMGVCLASALPAVREGSSRLFVTAAIDFDGAITEDDILAAAFDALNAGADAVITARGLPSVRRLAVEEASQNGPSKMFTSLARPARTSASVSPACKRLVRLSHASKRA